MPSVRWIVNSEELQGGVATFAGELTKDEDLIS